MNDKLVYLMRGLPTCDKSFTAKKLASVEVNTFFVFRQNGALSIGSAVEGSTGERV